MAVTALEVKTRCLFTQGLAFGKVGPYEQLEGTAYFAFDPDNPSNATITDLKLAPRDANGLVRCSSDFRILKPAAPQRGNHRVLSQARSTARGAFPWITPPAMAPGCSNHATSWTTGRCSGLPWYAWIDG